MQLQVILDELEHYKPTKNYLQFDINEEKLVNLLTEQENHSLKDQNRRLEKDNEVSRKCYLIRMKKYRV